MEKEYYWSIIIEEGFLQAAIWTIEEGVVEVISASSVFAWENEESLIEVSDKALSVAVDNFPEDAKEPSKTVFGVPPSWVMDGQIKKEVLDKIRQICAKLSLSPSGFVVLPESVAHWIKIEEGSPLTGVVVGVGK